MIGPVQFIMIAYDQPEPPSALVNRVQGLKADPAVRIIDVLGISKDETGRVQQRVVADITVGHVDEPGAMILGLLKESGATVTVQQPQWTGPAHLFRGDMLPDPRETIPVGSHVLAILLEHRWASALRDAAADAGTHAVANGWIGRDELMKLGLTSQERR
jgi:hypothetical protein